MHGSIWPVTIPPPDSPPGIFSFLGGLTPPQGTQKETISQPELLIDLIIRRFFVYRFDPYKSKTRRFLNFYKRLPELIERRITDVIM